MATIHPEAFSLALDSRGMSVTELSRKSGIPRQRLKRYADPLTQRYLGFQSIGHEIPDEELEVISAWLKYPISFFGQIIQRYPVRFCDPLGEEMETTRINRV